MLLLILFDHAVADDADDDDGNDDDYDQDYDAGDRRWKQRRRWKREMQGVCLLTACVILRHEGHATARRSTATELRRDHLRLHFVLLLEAERRGPQVQKI